MQKIRRSFEFSVCYFDFFLGPLRLNFNNTQLRASGEQRALSKGGEENNLEWQGIKRDLLKG